MDDLVIGDTLHWYVAGKTHEKPCAATVLDVHHGGMVTLNVHFHDGTVHYKRNVWPVGHKNLADNPDIAMKNGAWKFPRPKVEAPPFSLDSKPDSKPELPKKKQPETATA